MQRTSNADIRDTITKRVLEEAQKLASETNSAVSSSVTLKILREIAAELNTSFQMDAQRWAKFLSFVLPSKKREMVLVGILGLGEHAAQLDDLFGERAGGWGRELNNWEVTDQLAVPIGAWVRADLSRVGYLEAWVVRGENVWKKRLGIVSTTRLNLRGEQHPNETFRVLRHAMGNEDPRIMRAVAWALQKVKDVEAVERFLAWWAPRCEKAYFLEIMKNLPASSRKRLLALV